MRVWKRISSAARKCDCTVCTAQCAVSPFSSVRMDGSFVRTGCCQQVSVDCLSTNNSLLNSCTSRHHMLSTRTSCRSARSDLGMKTRMRTPHWGVITTHKFYDWKTKMQSCKFSKSLCKKQQDVFGCRFCWKLKVNLKLMRWIRSEWGTFYGQNQRLIQRLIQRNLVPNSECL